MVWPWPPHSAAREGNDFHWFGRACKIYTLVGREWKMIAHTGLLQYPGMDSP
ncbi:MAG: hypothetical protein ACOC5M_03895 [Chloroflexota bacterium]